MTPCGVAGLGKGRPLPTSRTLPNTIYHSNTIHEKTKNRPWTPTVFATHQTFEHLINLVQQLLFPLQQAQLPLALLLSGTDVDDVAADLGLAQLSEFLVNARLQFNSLGQQ